MKKKIAPQERGTKQSKTNLNLSYQADKGNKVLTPIKAIRTYCVGCCLGSCSEVRQCHSIDCPLHPYRLGKHSQGKITPRQVAKHAQRQQMVSGDEWERLALIWNDGGEKNV